MVNPIRKCRLERRLTQEGLADRARLSVRTVQRAEAGSVTPSAETLEAVAEVLEVAPGKLTMTHEMPEAVKAALRKIHEGMHDLSTYMYEHPEEIVKFGASHGTYVFQPRDVPPEWHSLICGEALQFHHAHFVETRSIRKERGENPDGSGGPWISHLCPGPVVSAVIDVSPWRPLLWRATADFTLRRDGQWDDAPEGTVEQIEVKEGDCVELVRGDWCGGFLNEFGKRAKVVRVGDKKVWTEFHHEELPVVPMLDQEREPWKAPPGLS